MHKDSPICKPLGIPPIQIGAGTALEHFSFRLNLSAVIARLDPAIHLLTKMDGCAGQAPYALS
jgi:hypothetical protein